MTCPFTGEEIVLLPALNPDVALIHVQRCDAYGNAQLDGLQFMDIDMAMAANRVILTTERIVSNEQIRRTPDQTRIPFFTVEAVVEAPIGCAPHECYGLYEPFFAHLDDYAARSPRTRSRARSSISRSITTSRSPGPTISACSAWMPCSMRAAAAGAFTMTKHDPADAQPTRPRSCSPSWPSRLLKDGQIVFAGIGIPLLAATLAQRKFAPHLTILFEGGTIGPFIVPGELPPSTNEQRCTRRANMVLPITDVLLLLQRGYVDVGFMGGAQIDRFGNLNSSFIGDADNPKTRLPGTGGGNDISSLTNMIVAMKHEKRRFVADVDFITSPGWIKGRRTRAESGLPEGGMWRVVTDLAIMGFDDETREMKVLALQQGVTREQVQDNTGFKLLFDKKLETVEPPRKEELAVLRAPGPRAAVYGVTLSSALSRDQPSTMLEHACDGSRATRRYRIRSTHGQEADPCSASPCGTSPSIRRCRARRG